MSTGDRAENLMKAIVCCDAALRVYSEEEFPQKWASLQNILGNAWGDMPTDDLSANLKKAIACYEAALRVFTEQQYPQDWAYTQSGIGHI